MNVWIASHECAGIVEAGGVKNVTFSLCKELQKAGKNVSLFIPVFKCTSYDQVQILEENFLSLEIPFCDKTEKISFTKARSKDYGFEVIFFNHPSFSEKEAVYTYTAQEEKLNPEHKKGWGHGDSKFKDVIFAKAVNEYGKMVSEDLIPDIIHCQDASTATIPFFTSRNERLKKAWNIVTIHNAGPAYHHEFFNIDEAAWYMGYDLEYFKDSMNEERVEPFLIAANSGALLTTVSPDYAEELLDPANSASTDGLSRIFNQKNIKILGITNGIDVSLYEPSDSKISCLPYTFSPENKDLEGKYLNRKFFVKKLNENHEDILREIKKYGNINPEDCEKDLTWLCYQGRLASQKGLAVLSETLPLIIRQDENIRVIVTGQGEGELENRFRNVAENPEFLGKIIFLNGYNKIAARLTVTSGDLIILPSFFEPCGLEDFIALIYGTIPVAHKTGGLNKILDGKTGFLYEGNTVEKLFSAVKRSVDFKKAAPELFNEMIRDGASYTRNRYDWEKVCKNEYIPLFEKK